MTNAPRITSALVDTIARAPAFRVRQCTLAHPGALIEAEAVFIVGVKNAETARGLGAGHRREVLSIELALVAEVMSDDYTDVLDRAWRMLADVEQVIGSNPTLDGRCHFAVITGFDQKNYAGDGKRSVEISVTVEATADKDAS